MLSELVSEINSSTDEINSIIDEISNVGTRKYSVIGEWFKSNYKIEALTWIELDIKPNRTSSIRI